MPNASRQPEVKMTTDFPTAPPAYGLEGPSADSTVEKSHSASHIEILTLPIAGRDFLVSEACGSELGGMPTVRKEGWIWEARRQNMIHVLTAASCQAKSTHIYIGHIASSRHSFGALCT